MNEVLNNNQIFDELDEKIDKSYPELLKNSLKLMRGVYIYNKKKILVQENFVIIRRDSLSLRPYYDRVFYVVK